MLTLKPNCECCDADLPPQSTEARICTFECTFCATCAEGPLHGVCPNCGGNFAPRPIRPAHLLARFPPSSERILHEAGCRSAAAGTYDLPGRDRDDRPNAACRTRPSRVRLQGRLLAKLEMRNPCGSVKDRLGLALIEDAEARGRLRPGATLIEATGGNTGIGLASAAAVKGYRLILTMPEAMSAERAALLRHLGADVRLTPGILMAAAVALAHDVARTIPNGFLVDQFNNPANVLMHQRTIAEEIWADTAGQIDVFVSAVGTGGALMGVATALKPRRPAMRVVAVEPAGAAVLSGRPVGQHRIPGIGVGFVPPLLDRSLIDEASR